MLRQYRRHLRRNKVLQHWPRSLSEPLTRPFTLSLFPDELTTHVALSLIGIYLNGRYDIQHNDTHDVMLSVAFLLSCNVVAPLKWTIYSITKSDIILNSTFHFVIFVNATLNNLNILTQLSIVFLFRVFSICFLRVVIVDVFVNILQ